MSQCAKNVKVTNSNTKSSQYIRTLSDNIPAFSILKVARSFFWAGNLSRTRCKKREKEMLIYYNTKNIMCGKTLTSFLSSLPRVVVHYCSVASLPLRMILSCHHVTSSEKMRKKRTLSKGPKIIQSFTVILSQKVDFQKACT